MFALLIGLACASPDKGVDPGQAGDSAETALPGDTAEKTGDDTGSSEDTNTSEPICGVRVGDDWAWSGGCPGMITPCEVLMNGCEMLLRYPSGMDMGMPYGAAVRGSDVTFDDGASLAACAATLVSPNKMSGSCSGGCTFLLSR